jgi:hypothetical protein
MHKDHNPAYLKLFSKKMTAKLGYLIYFISLLSGSLLTLHTRSLF